MPDDGDAPADGDSVSPGDEDGDALTDAETPADTDAKDSGCGAGPASLWWPLVTALIGLRRRRR